ncbi:murein hydrolase activator NlpD [Candidatus Pantoea carbekii]|nr:murein hydrolase activator NlpD [Candidatus Pantoea carbekii]AKC32423.1 lipoprotein NlpD [Candidatus Pantoea carbekii]
MEGIVFQLRCLTVFLLGSVWLIGCSYCTSPAPIRQIKNKVMSTITSSLSNTMLTKQNKKEVNGSKSTVFSKKHQLNDHKYMVYNRNYIKIPKKIYHFNIYTVQNDDTLFYITWVTGNNVRNLAKYNKISKPYIVIHAQILKVRVNKKTNSSSSIINKKNDTQNNIVNNIQQSKIKCNPVIQQPICAVNLVTASDHKLFISKKLNNKVILSVSKAPLVTQTTSWYWPTHGKIISEFSSAEHGNKGIDIGGSYGQPVFATASGKVVYSGNALHGYGNLIIIKHDNNYLSAYAHNNTVLVKEKQQVKAGQKIATMGKTDINSVRLHFEIRYKGKSVNPLLYLPKQSYGRMN